MEQTLERLTRGEPRRQSSCVARNIGLCGPLVVEKEKYAKLEEQLKNMAKEDESNIYRKYFLTLLENTEFSFQLSGLLDIFKMDVSEIPEIKAVYYYQKARRVIFWVFLEKRNWDAEDKVYDTHDRTLTLFPEMDIGLKILRLEDRKPEELLPNGGVKLIGF